MVVLAPNPLLVCSGISTQLISIPLSTTITSIYALIRISMTVGLLSLVKTLKLLLLYSFYKNCNSSLPYQSSSFFTLYAVNHSSLCMLIMTLHCVRRIAHSCEPLSRTSSIVIWWSGSVLLLLPLSCALFLLYHPAC